MIKALESKVGQFQGREFKISKSNREIGIKKRIDENIVGEK